MSSPMMNSVLPSAGNPTPAGPVPPLSISVTSIKPAPAPPVIVKPQINHAASAPLSLVQEHKIKATEKPKESPTVPLKPTTNGIEEPPQIKVPVAVVPEESAPPVVPPVAPPVALPPPVATPAVPAAPAVVSAATAPAAPAVAPANAPEPVALAAATAAPPAVNHAAEPASSADSPAPAPEPEPAEAAPSAEPAKPKAAKPHAAKRRREPADAPPSEGGTPEKKPRRMRAPVNPYQSPLPEITTVINRSLKVRDNSQKPNDEKLIVFYKNEFLAVRNAEGGFYLCQTMQNIYRTSHKIRIRWLSRDEKESTNDGGIYTRDFYDATDFECILTTVALQKKDRNKYKMPAAELERVESILKRALDVEKGVSEKPAVTEEHPDGIDLSLYRDESQLQKAKSATKRKRPAPKSSSPKKAKKAKNVKEPSPSKAIKVNTPNKAKPPSRKPPAKRVVNPPLVEKKTSRAERSFAREKATTSSASARAISEKLTVALSAKAEKPEKINAKVQTVKGKKRVAPKAEKPAEVKVDKKQDKKKAKPVPPPAVAGTSKKTDKGKKAVSAIVAASEKRSPSTRKKNRK